MFIDVDTISPGSDFAAAIDRAVGQCDALVAVIGRHWADAALPDGRRRLDEPTDFVRLELESALANEVSVIPAAVQGAAFPDVGSLPVTLEPLARRQGIELRDTAWRDDVQRLIRRLEPERSRPNHRRRLLLLVGVAVAVAAIVAATLAITLSAGGGSPSSAQLDRQLLAAVRGSASPRCQKTPHGDGAPGAKASIQCFGVSHLIATYNRFANASVMNQWYEQMQEVARVTPSTGRCEASSFRGDGKRGDARYLCYFNKNGHPWIVWTDPKLKILSWAYINPGTGSSAARSLLHLWSCCFQLKNEAGLPPALVAAHAKS